MVANNLCDTIGCAICHTVKFSNDFTLELYWRVSIKRPGIIFSYLIFIKIVYKTRNEEVFIKTLINQLTFIFPVFIRQCAIYFLFLFNFILSVKLYTIIFKFGIISSPVVKYSVLASRYQFSVCKLLYFRLI